MIKSIQAKVLLAHVKQPDTWFGLKYNMNLYRGCQHQCIYCDSRSACYQIENFSDVLVKTNAIDLLQRELARKRVKGLIGTGSMSDPYTPAERQFNLTGQALEVIAQFGFPVHILTKSDMVLKDLDTLRKINRVKALVSFSITTADDDLARKVEPGAPSPSARFEAMATLAEEGIATGVLLMPVLPFLTDSPAQITAVIEQAAAHGADYVLPSFGLTLRDRQRDYFYTKLDKSFPGMRQRYGQRFGEQYHCAAPAAVQLQHTFKTLCAEHDLPTRIPPYKPAPQPTQLPLL